MSYTYTKDSDRVVKIPFEIMADKNKIAFSLTELIEMIEKSNKNKESEMFKAMSMMLPSNHIMNYSIDDIKKYLELEIYPNHQSFDEYVLSINYLCKSYQKSVWKNIEDEDYVNLLNKCEKLFTIISNEYIKKYNVETYNELFKRLNC